MSTDTHHDLVSFHQFLSEHLSSGQPCYSPEEALDAWRLQNRTPEEYAADLEAIREALADMDAGDTGTPWEEFDREFRKRHNIT